MRKPWRDISNCFLRRTTLIFFLLLIFSGCASTTVRFATTEKPLHELPQITTIAILDFSDAAYSPGSGRAISSGIVAELKKNGRFRLVERADLDKVLREQALGLTGAIDERTAAKVGALLGAQAVVTGEVVSYEIRETREKETETRTFKTGKWHYEKKKNPWSKEEEQVKVYEEEERPVDVFYRRKTASIVAGMRVVNTVTGEVMAAESKNASFEKRVPESISSLSGWNFFFLALEHVFSEKNPDRLPSDGELIVSLTSDVTAGLAGTISPHPVLRTYRLLKGRSRESRRGLEFARADAWDKAVDEWEKAAAREANDPAPHYNIGVANERFGRTMDARTAYEKALSLEPGNDIIRAAYSGIQLPDTASGTKQSGKRLFTVVRLADDGTLYLDFGEKDGASVGLRVALFSIEEIRHPETGEVLASEEKIVGFAAVSKIFEKMSILVPENLTRQVSVGEKLMVRKDGDRRAEPVAE